MRSSTPKSPGSTSDHASSSRPGRAPRPPVDPARLNPTSKTMWTNLGYWTGAHSYVEAARALALRVGHAAQLKRGDIVLDYACGYGDSLKLWVEEFGAARVIGVEPDPAVTAVVQRRVREWGMADRISVMTARAEDVLPSELVPRATAVVCVDAAYHFPKRCEWLGRVVKALPPGGRVGFSDLVFSEKAVGSWRMKKLAGLMQIPLENLQTCAGLEGRLEALGGRVVWSEAAGEAVLDGFVRGAPADGFRLKITRAALRVTRWKRGADYRIVGVERPTIELLIPM